MLTINNYLPLITYLCMQCTMIDKEFWTVRILRTWTICSLSKLFSENILHRSQNHKTAGWLIYGS